MIQKNKNKNNKIENYKKHCKKIRIAQILKRITKFLYIYKKESLKLRISLLFIMMIQKNKNKNNKIENYIAQTSKGITKFLYIYIKKMNIIIVYVSKI